MLVISIIALNLYPGTIFQLWNRELKLSRTQHFYEARDEVRIWSSLRDWVGQEKDVHQEVPEVCVRFSTIPCIMTGLHTCRMRLHKVFQKAAAVIIRTFKWSRKAEESGRDLTGLPSWLWRWEKQELKNIDGIQILKK